MNRKEKYPVNLSYCIYLDELEADPEDSMHKLLDRLPEYFRHAKNNCGYNVLISRNNDTLILNIRGDMEIDFTLVDTSAVGYHYEIDGESSFDCMTREDFDRIVINAMKECAKDILDTDIYEHDGSHVKTVHLSDSISYFLADYNKNVGYPCDDDIWGLVE